MPTLNIEGKRVKVDDAFLSMSPDEQARAVEEIASQIGVTPAQQQNAAPEAPQEQPDIMRQRAMAEAAKIREWQGEPSAFKAATNSVLQGATFGFGDEIMAGLNTPLRMIRDGVNPKEAYAREKALQDALIEADRQSNPIASAAGNVAGGLLTGGALAKGGATLIGRNVPYVGKTGAAALEGAAYGGAYGAGEAQSGERLKGAATGAATGAVTGALTERVGGAIARQLNKAPKPQAIPSSQLADEAGALYAQAEQAGVTIKPKAMDRVITNMRMVAGRRNDVLRKGTAGILDELDALQGKGMTLSELDEFRQVIGQTMKRAEPQDVRTLQRMKTTLDAFFENQIKPGDITGDVKGFDFIKQARSVYARKAKTEMLEDMVEQAKNQATGFENGLVIKFRQLANNADKMKMFTPEERKMITDVVRRGSARGILAMLGRMAPNSTFGGLANLGVAGTTGLLPGAAVATTGLMAQKAAEAMTRGQVNRAINSISSGILPVQSALPRVAAPLIPGITSQTAPLPVRSRQN